MATASGVAIPSTPLAVPDGFRRTPVAVEMDLGEQTVFVAVVHPPSPFPANTAAWSAELGRLADWLGPLDGPIIVAGDFNATYDHRPFRDLLATGLRDAAEQVGAGFLPTYPAHRRRIPLLITIDHVLSGGGIVAVDLQRVDVDDTDHAGLVAVLAVPRPPDAGQRGRTVVVTATIDGCRGAELKPKRTGGSTSASGPRSTPSHVAWTALDVVAVGGAVELLPAGRRPACADAAHRQPGDRVDERGPAVLVAIAVGTPRRAHPSGSRPPIVTSATNGPPVNRRRPSLRSVPTAATTVSSNP